ncbi:TRAP transporter large permease [Desertibacillus haloalkaliphilus]|uniref:TRAP transporter large permease n=1 Tax=Desertibacillus haloalkaliphilus TaxID=1328930 RepID=UPI001C25FBAA|nr:TRAP transporter large permease [Desertibacillus haloalkaliphilus]MBU8906230.1 TRAP transporter large permease [Desertibacillus haloalkaliphilus]
MLLVGFLILLLLLIIGAPIWLALAASGGYWVFVHMGLPLESIASQFFTSTDQWILLAVPYFLLAGNLMTFMGPASKLFTFIKDLVGHLPGGMPAAVVATAAIFGALSGSSVATVVAVGSMAIPQMIAMGHSKENSYGVIAASGTLGQMIPPSIFMILFAASTQLDPGKLFIAGIVPGIFVAVVLIIVAIIVSFKNTTEKPKRSSLSETSRSFIGAVPSLLMPFLILGGIYGGIFTPTEAAAIAIVYVLLISFLFNRKDCTAENFKKSLISTMVTTSIIYILLGGAQLFTTAITYLQVPQTITEVALNIDMADWMIMLVIILIFLLFGMFLDAIPILYITLPVLYPTVLTLGYDPIHFAMVAVATLMIGQITPPIGSSLYAISGHFKENMGVVVRGSFPYLIGMLIATLVLLYVPWLSTFLFN